MYQWSDDQLVARNAIRDFVNKEIRPHVDELEFGDLAPYGLLRRMFQAFGVDKMARESFAHRMESDSGPSDAHSGGQASEAAAAALNSIATIELSRVCPGMVTALGVSVGLTPAAIMKKGTREQKKRWVPDLLALDKVGAWAITEPDSGSDAFGSMRSTARRDGDGYVLNGSKTFITNGPHADTIVFICKLDEGNPPAERKVLSFVLDGDTPGLERSQPLRKMGLHSSPTGQLFLSDVRVGKDRLIGETEDVAAGREGAKATFVQERTGVTAMALGIISECLSLSTKYARERIQFGRPIGQFQLIQEKLALMEVARLNVENLIFRSVEMAEEGREMTLAEASAMKLYSARVATDVALAAVQLFGGNGYMSEYRVEQLARDSKVLQIYGGTDEIQITHIARDLLGM
jgi:alkylation response protein AidB-like acyl-CoA dehydrogenase